MNCRITEDGRPTGDGGHGLLDLIAYDEHGGLVGVQYTAETGYSSRYLRMIEHPQWAALRRTPIAVQLWAWRTKPDADGAYRVRIYHADSGEVEVERYYPSRSAPVLRFSG